jgi:hypothetical protein
MSYVLTLCLLFVSATVAAQPPLEADQWNPRTKVWLARAMVGEAGWTASRDHVGIAYVLAKRFERIRRRWPDIRFLDVVLAYAKALGDGRRSLTSRQRWIRSLGGAEKPVGWPTRANWPRVHRPLWKKTLKRADDWFAGKLRDPCRGRAFNWGGYLDVDLAMRKRLNPVDCGDTRNTFYDDGGHDG